MAKMTLTVMEVLRRQHNLTQLELGQKLSPTQPQSRISAIESGAKTPYKLLKEISETLGYDGDPENLQREYSPEPAAV